MENRREYIENLKNLGVDNLSIREKNYLKLEENITVTKNPNKHCKDTFQPIASYTIDFPIELSTDISKSNLYVESMLAEIILDKMKEAK